jgi:hypothetical protein
MWLNIYMPGNGLGGLDLGEAPDGSSKNIYIITAGNNAECGAPALEGDCSTRKATAFPRDVLDALEDRGQGTTVKDLIDFASDVLGGGEDYGVSLSKLTNALDALVEAFHSGRIFKGFLNSSELNCPTSTTGKKNTVLDESAFTSSAVADAAPQVSVDKLSVKAFPNPFVDELRFTVSVKEGGKGNLTVYNMLGQKVKTIFDGEFKSNSIQTIPYTVPGSVRTGLVYVLRINGQIRSGVLIRTR